MAYLYIPVEQWHEAERFFRENPTEIKFKKQGSGGRSFVKLYDDSKDETKILALAHGKDRAEGVLGEGSFARVKIGQDKWGNQYAVKIEGQGVKDIKEAEISILTALNVFEGFGRRVLDQYKMYKNALTTEKLYTAMQKYEGKNLMSKLWEMHNGQPVSQRQLPMLEKLKIAQKCCQAVKKCHDKNIVHCDIKPGNFMITESLEGEILIYLIDFGFAKQLPPMEQRVLGAACGSPAFMAPELMPQISPMTDGGQQEASKVPFSKDSDIFALGKLFENELHLDASIWVDMVLENPQHRVDINTVLERVNQALYGEAHSQREGGIQYLPQQHPQYHPQQPRPHQQMGQHVVYVRQHQQQQTPNQPLQRYGTPRAVMQVVRKAPNAQ